MAAIHADRRVPALFIGKRRRTELVRWTHECSRERDRVWLSLEKMGPDRRPMEFLGNNRHRG